MVRTTCSYKYNAPCCQVGKNVKECYEFSNHVTEETFKVSHYFDCNSNSLVYLMKVYGKQFAGSTKESSRFRWNNYKSCRRKAERVEDCIQKYLHEHFLREGHNGFINDVEIIFIDKTDPSDSARTETFWKIKLKAVTPYSLNV